MIDKIREVIEPLIEEAGYKLIKVEKDQNSLIVTIDGKSTKDCAIVSRKIDPILEEKGLIKDNSLLIVSSFGIN